LLVTGHPVTWCHFPEEWMPHIKELLSKVTTNKQTAKDEFTQIQLLLYTKISNSLKSVRWTPPLPDELSYAE
jgi:carbonic anhydrase